VPVSQHRPSARRHLHAARATPTRTLRDRDRRPVRDLGVVIKQQHEVTGSCARAIACLASPPPADRSRRGTPSSDRRLVGRRRPPRPRRYPRAPTSRHKFMTAPFRRPRIPAPPLSSIRTRTSPFVARARTLARPWTSRRADGSARDRPDLEPALIERAIHRRRRWPRRVMRAWAGLYEMTPDQTRYRERGPGRRRPHVIAGFSGQASCTGLAGQLMPRCSPWPLRDDGRRPLDSGRFAAAKLTSSRSRSF